MRMDYIDDFPVDRLLKIASFLAKFSFFIYVFFLIFGTRAPFLEQIKNVEDIRTSNPINQFVYSSLYVISFIAILPKGRKFIDLIINEKFLTCFLIWSFLSIFWSDVPFISFKRWLQLFGGVLIISTVLLYIESTDEALGYFKAVFIIYIFLTFLSLLFIPEAIAWKFDAWRGLAPTKNTLGQISFVSLIIWSIALLERGVVKKTVALIFWCLSLALVLGSRSTTCILTGGILLYILVLFSITNRFLKPIVGKFFAIAFFLTFLVCLIAIGYWKIEFIESFLSLFGKDITLTGRTELWGRVFDETKNYLLYGCGYGGFWLVDTPILDSIYREFIWLPNEAHLGYLDILNETGIVGLCIFFLMVIMYFSRALKLDKPYSLKWFVISVLILNLSESSLLYPNSLTGDLFLLAYLALQVDLMKNHESTG